MKLEFYWQRSCEDKNTKNQTVWIGGSLPLGFTRLMTISGLINGMDLLIQGADKSLAWPGRKQATATEDFDIHISYLLS